MINWKLDHAQHRFWVNLYETATSTKRPVVSFPKVADFRHLIENYSNCTYNINTNRTYSTDMIAYGNITYLQSRKIFTTRLWTLDI